MITIEDCPVSARALDFSGTADYVGTTAAIICYSRSRFHE